MAVWHFKFCILPRDGLRRVLGCIPPLLSEHVVSAELLFGADDPPNYWDGLDMSGVVSSVRRLFPSASGLNEYQTFGDDERNKVVVYPSGIYCYIDLRDYDRRLVTEILYAAHRHNCVVAVIGPGSIIEPSIRTLESYIPSSGAYAFCADPEGYLVTSGRRMPLMPISPEPVESEGNSNIPPKRIPPNPD